MLALIGGPSGQDNQLKRGVYAPPLAKGLRVNLNRAHHHRAPCRPATTAHQGVVFPHGTQIMHQVQGRLIAGPERDAVGHRQGKPGPLQQRAKITDFPHRRDARRQPAHDLRLGLGQ